MTLRDYDHCPKSPIQNGRFVMVATVLAYVRLMASGVYFVECAGFIKIGISGIIENRLFVLRTSCPLQVTPLGFISEPEDDVAALTERRIHDRFASVRHNGEWFIATPELRQFISDVSQPWPKSKRAVQP